MAITIRDVAQAAGVSTATVSNVLNHTGKVGAKTQRHVLSTVKRLGYVPDVHARHLASRDSRTLGIIVSDIENPFFPEVIKSFEARAQQLGYDAILSDTNYDPHRTKQAADRMMEHKVRGVAIMTSEISMKRIAFVAGRAGLKSNTLRRRAYEKCMHELGLEPGPVLPGNLRFDGGLEAGIAVARLHPRPTAVMAINDLTAIGVIKCLLQAGCRVPEDISVTGFDKTRLAEYSNPSLTTVDIHRDLLGSMAADALDELSGSANPHGKEYRISAELVVGASTGPVPRTE